MRKPRSLRIERLLLLSCSGIMVGSALGNVGEPRLFGKNRKKR